MRAVLAQWTSTREITAGEGVKTILITIFITKNCYSTRMIKEDIILLLFTIAKKLTDMYMCIVQKAVNHILL